MKEQDSLDTEDKVNNAIDWITALAQSEYRQKRGNLGYSGSYCCLGVLANEVGIERDEDENEFYIRDDGMEPVNEVGLRPFRQHELSGRNDSEGSSLDEYDPHRHYDIARLLLTNPYDYFVPEVAEGIKEHFYR